MLEGAGRIVDEKNLVAAGNASEWLSLARRFVTEDGW